MSEDVRFTLTGFTKKGNKTKKHISKIRLILEKVLVVLIAGR